MIKDEVLFVFSARLFSITSFYSLGIPFDGEWRRKRPMAGERGRSAKKRWRGAGGACKKSASSFTALRSPSPPRRKFDSPKKEEEEEVGEVSGSADSERTTEIAGENLEKTTLESSHSSVSSRFLLAKPQVLLTTLTCCSPP